MLLRIALRNLTLHKAKTLIIGTLVFLGVFLNFLGSNLLTELSENMGLSFSENFTGDILIRHSEQVSGVFGASTAEEPGSPPVLKTLEGFPEVWDYASALPEVESVTSTYSAFVMPNFGEMGMDFFLVFGIEPESYTATFPGVRVTDGRLMRPGEEGLVLHAKTREILEKNYSVDLGPGSQLQLNNFGAAGFKIRTVPIVGTFEFESGNDRLFIPSLLDIQSVRSLFGKVSVSAADVTIRPEKKVLLGDLNLDDLFGGDMIESVAPSALPSVDFDKVLGPLPEAPPEADAATGNWSFILLRTHEGTDIPALIERMNADFLERGWKVFAQGWFESAAPDSLLFLGLGFLLNAVVILLAIVTIVVIMNTLVASVIERTNELGTMRALGARKGFVARMIILETFLVVGVFGVLAVGVGSLTVAVIGVSNIEATTDLLKSLFAGPVFQPSIRPDSLLVSLVLMTVIAGISWIFPVLMAVKITPLKAMTLE